MQVCYKALRLRSLIQKASSSSLHVKADDSVWTYGLCKTMNIS